MMTSSYQETAVTNPKWSYILYSAVAREVYCKAVGGGGGRRRRGARGVKSIRVMLDTIGHRTHVGIQ